MFIYNTDFDTTLNLDRADTYNTYFNLQNNIERSTPNRQTIDRDIMLLTNLYY
jgi:hypothetical protein